MFDIFKKPKKILKNKQVKKYTATSVVVDNISITLKRKLRARGVRIVIGARDGKVVVTYGGFTRESSVVKLIESKIPWIKEKIKVFENRNPVLVQKHSKEEIKKYYADALILVNNKLSHFNKYYNFEYKKVTIRNNKTRWGSCSSQKNLSFYYKIIFLPEELQDYLIVHELCHLMEFNHSKAFWSLVGERVGDYERLNKALKIGDFK